MKIKNVLLAITTAISVAAVTYIGLRRAELSPVTEITAAVTQQACGFGGLELHEFPELQRVVVNAVVYSVKREPLWKRIGICAMTVYQPIEAPQL